MRIAVRRLEYKDLSERVAWFNTPSIYTQMLIDVPLSIAGTEKWFRERVLDERHHDFVFLICRSDAEPNLCAMGGLTDVSYRHRRAELYVVVRPGETGRGIGSAVVKWLCNYGFLQLNLWRIQLYTFHENERARRVYERLGFIHEGVLRGHVFHQGRFADRHIQSLLRCDWERQPWRLEEPLPLTVEVDSVGQ